MVLDRHSKVCIPRIYLNPLPSQPLPFRASALSLIVLIWDYDGVKLKNLSDGPVFL